MRHFRGRSALYPIGRLGGAETANLLELLVRAWAKLPRQGLVGSCVANGSIRVECCYGPGPVVLTEPDLHSLQSMYNANHMVLRLFRAPGPASCSRPLVGAGRL